MSPWDSFCRMENWSRPWFLKSDSGRKVVEAFEVRFDGALVCQELSLSLPEASLSTWLAVFQPDLS